MKTSRQKRLPIEEYALLTESAPELGEKLDQWYNFYQPATPGECELVDGDGRVGLTPTRPAGGCRWYGHGAFDSL